MTTPSPDENGQLLYQAALYSNADLLADLLGGDYGHRLDFTDAQGRTALHVAAANGHLPCIQLLVKAGANVNAVAGSIGHCKTPLHAAAENGHTEAVRLLVSAGADLFFQDLADHCPLQSAQMADQQATACVLIDAIESHQNRTRQLRQELETACINGDATAADRILCEADAQSISAVLNGTNEDDYSALYRACERGHAQLVELLLRYGADGRVHAVTRYSPLYIASSAGHIKVIELLLQSFPELTQVATCEGWTPLHAACKSGELPVIRRLLFHLFPRSATQPFTDASGKWTYRFGFDVNAPDAECRTPLYLACAEGHRDAVKLLLDFTVDAERCLESPRRGAPKETFEDVVVHDRQPAKRRESRSSSSETPAGDTPVKKARSKLNTVAQSPEGEAAADAPTVHRICPFTVDVYCGRGRTPLMAAAIGGHTSIVQLLVKKGGANVNLPIAITDEELARLNPTEEGVHCAGSGALIEACRIGNTVLVETLLELGAVDHDNQALAATLQGGHEELACRLLCRQVFPDPEFRINKKSVDVDLHAGIGRSVVPSALYPAAASMLNWHKASLGDLRAEWLLAAGLHLNPKLRTGQLTTGLALSAITRVDVSKNALTSLPVGLFQLPSLRILNAAFNKVHTIETGRGDGRNQRTSGGARNRRASLCNWNAPVLEEVHLEHNELELLPDELFSHLPSLTSLDVSSNSLVALPHSVWAAQKLKDLNASRNSLSYLPSWSAIDRSPSQSLSSLDAHDDDSEAARRSFGSMSMTSFDDPLSVTTDRDSVASGLPKPSDDNITVQELRRHNLWQSSVTLTKVDDDELEDAPAQTVPAAKTDQPRRRTRSSLTSLNLSYNQFQRAPECLPCLGAGLVRLNLSANRLAEIGPVCNYPARLRHLDLSSNNIAGWFCGPKSGADMLCHCGHGRESLIGRPTSPTRSSRTRSKSAARGQRSLSVARSELNGTLSPLSAATVCPHKRHTRLENLRTLVVAGNRMERISLLPDSFSMSSGTSSTSLDQAFDAPLSPNVDVRCLIIILYIEARLGRSRLVFPCLTMLDASNNRLKTVPSDISELSSLSVLNLSNNPDITALPPEMGLLSKLWNLSLKGCNLGEPLCTMLDSKKYKTMDIMGYLKSVLEDSKPYTRLKLMIVGIQGIGKTSLLEQLRLEGTVSKRSQDGWAKRMGNKNVGQKTAKGINISTVGVDVGDWTYEPKKAKNQPNFGPITFRTWDFGGQREYYATHQYFLSRRSLYLVVWKITDGEAGVAEIQQWLVNIQARAPNSPVVIVGTHYDEVLTNSKKFPGSFVDDLQQIIRERFVVVQDADKKGLPRVVDSVIVSSKTRFNIRHLCNMIYNTAFEQRSPGTKERLLDQKIPATYLALEDIVGQIADEKKAKGKDPVMSGDQFRTAIQDRMQQQYGKTFRDTAELHQATSFLHENGVMLHYDDATLKDLFFLDPQWLCDILAHVVTIREINPFAKNGLMRLDDLNILFKAARFTPTNIRNYILNLLQKFEVALTWDSRSLLIPSLLPDEYQLRGGYYGCEVKIPLKTGGWIFSLAERPVVEPKTPHYSGAPTADNLMSSRSIFYTQSIDEIGKKPLTQSPSRPIGESRQFATFDSLKQLSLDSSMGGTPMLEKPVPIFTLDRSTAAEPETEYYVHSEAVDDLSIRRLYMMAYVPSGFWSRLITRILGEEQLPGFFDKLFRVTNASTMRTTPAGRFDTHGNRRLRKILEANRPEWLLWQTGMQVNAFGRLLFSLKEFLPLAEIRDVNYAAVRWQCKQDDGAWRRLNADRYSLLEFFVPGIRLTLRYPGKGGTAEFVQLETDPTVMTRLLAVVVDVIDTLLEDWYPSLGTRFVHTSEGKLLVSRIVPCPKCIAPFDCSGDRAVGGGWTILSLDELAHADPNTPRKVSTASHASDAGQSEPAGLRRPRSASAVDIPDLEKLRDEKDSTNVTPDQGAYCFTIEDCILCGHQSVSPKCPTHGQLSLAWIAPDTVFLDISKDFLVIPELVKRGKMLGRGAFGFVFKAAVKHREHGVVADVALKMLQPVDPGFGARQSANAAYKAAWAKWQRDPLQYACRAYCTSRQELNVLSSLHHPNVVSLIGVCPRPLALVVELAPLGALNHLLQNYRRSGARLNLTVLQETCSQVAKALEYLHQEHIIYRDLKCENVLAWRYPPPFSHLTDVLVKLGDYGISRSTFPSGGAKGFGGTEGFMAPEIMRYNGEEEYTEKVDCFSFAMFAYELLSFKLPFDGQEQVKEFMLDGGRPQLTPSELLYPCNVLDLMVVAWSQQPGDRPSSSQLVSITTAPEFSHLLDVVALNDGDAAVLSGESFSVDDADLNDGPIAVEDGFEGELWLSRSDGSVSVLTCNQYGWLDYKSMQVNEDSFVTAMCLVEDTVWLGELTGLIRVYCAKTYCELYCFSVAPHVFPTEQSPKHQLSVPVAEIMSLSALRLVLIATSQPGALLLCRMMDNLGGQGLDPVLTCVKSSARELHCVAALPSHKGTIDLWTGQSAGHIGVFQASGEALTEVATINHYDPIVEGVEVYRLVASSSDGAFVWSYVYPGSVLYQWNAAQRAIVAKLDSSKIAPCSESINTINIEERLTPGRCQVTALCLLDRDDGAQLYIGTTWGVVIVAEADQLRPLAAFRPHLEDVRVILPIDSSKRAVILAQQLRAASTADGLSSISRFSDSRDATRGSETSHKAGRGSAASNHSSQHSPLPFDKNDGERKHRTENYVLTVGKGYRCLIQRFLDNYREDANVLDSRNKDNFALMWRTDDWM